MRDYNTRHLLTQDCLDRNAEIRNLVLELLKQSKLNGGSTAVSTDSLSSIWAMLGNISMNLGDVSKEFDEFVAYCNSHHSTE